MDDVPLGVVGALLLENLGNDGDGRVDRVRDDKNKGLGRVLSNANSNVANDTGIDLHGYQALRVIIDVDARSRSGSFGGAKKEAHCLQVHQVLLGALGNMVENSVPGVKGHKRRIQRGLRQ